MEIFNTDSISLKNLSSKVRKHEQYLPLRFKRKKTVALLNSGVLVLLR